MPSVRKAKNGSGRAGSVADDLRRPAGAIKPTEGFILMINQLLLATPIAARQRAS
jgi:hypothetical protein